MNVDDFTREFETIVKSEMVDGAIKKGAPCFQSFP